MPRYQCCDCRRRLNAGWHCEDCRELADRLRQLHQGTAPRHTDSDHPDNAGRELRVMLYAAVVERGGRLFEKGGVS